MKRALLLVVSTLAACGTANSRRSPAITDGGSGAESADSGASATGLAGSPGGGNGAAGAGAPAEASEGGAAPGGAPPSGGADDSAGQGSCERDASLDSSSLARGVALQQIAVYQAVKVSIMELGREVSPRKTSLLSGRPALLRAYVKPAEAWSSRVIRARLSLSYPLSGNEPQVLEQTRRIEQASTEAQLSSTFNFPISASLMTEDLTYSVELLETTSCPPALEERGARFPETLELAMSPKPETTLHVQLVPVVYEAGDVKLTPDTSGEQIERFRRTLLRLFPLSNIELSVRAQALVTTAQTMVEVLDQVAALREAEAPPPNLAYYGLVRLRETREQYCNPSCVLGASLNGELPAVGVGVGISYSGEEAATTMAHELGHVYGRPHSPCGVTGDPAFPYSGGRIGSWGYDNDAKTLLDPSSFSDFMGYCSPSWVSDYTYERLREFIAAVEPTSPPTATRHVQSAPAAPHGYRTLLLTPGAPPSWGAFRKLRGAPAGQAEDARAHAAGGDGAGSPATIFRRRVAGTSTDIVYVPQWVYEGWSSLDTEQGRIALPPRFAPRAEGN